MFKLNKFIKTMGFAILIGLISLTAVVASNQINQDKPQIPILPTIIVPPTATRPAYCVPLPREPSIVGTLTPTPDRLTAVFPYTNPSITPRSFTHIYDLSPELPLSEKWKLEIFRCNGTLDRYLAGPDVDIHQFLELKAGDVVIGSGPPASMMGHQPPEPPGSEPSHIPPTSIPTSSPYPPPATPSV